MTVDQIQKSKDTFSWHIKQCVWMGYSPESYKKLIAIEEQLLEMLDKWVEYQQSLINQENTI